MNPPNTSVDTALHVLKGAVQKVLNAAVTTSVYAESSESGKGRLTVEYDSSPTDEQLQQIETLANDKIKENASIQMLQLDRKEAEAKFGSSIYDKYPVPPHIQQLSITLIENWNVNCCLGPHLKTTGELGSLKILKHRAGPARKELEISFEVANA